MTFGYLKKGNVKPNNMLMELAYVRLPFRRIASVPGDAGFGPSAPAATPSPAGIVVTRRGCVSLFDHDLSRELWRIRFADWSGAAVITGDAVVHGVADGRVREMALRDGKLRRSFSYEGLASVEGVQDKLCILHTIKTLQGVDWSGRTLWSTEIAPSGLKAHFRGRLYASALDPFRRALLCISALTGEVLWRATLPTEGTGDAAMMSGTVGPVAATTDRVLVIPSDGRRLIVLAAESGEIESIERLPALPARGHFVVTEKEVVLFHPFMLSFFDHREMKETRRLELRDEVQPLYGDHPPIAHAFCLAQNAVIWTTPHGAFMGIHLEPEPDGRRITWVEELPGALMPVGVPPVVHDGRMYYTNMGEPLELMCYVSGR